MQKNTLPFSGAFFICKRRLQNHTYLSKCRRRSFVFFDITFCSRYAVRGDGSVFFFCVCPLKLCAIMFAFCRKSHLYKEMPVALLYDQFLKQALPKVNILRVSNFITSKYFIIIKNTKQN